jgi:hypothetical protein
MLESILVLGALALLALGAWVAPLLPLESVVGLGWVVTAAGLLLGLPAGLAYHLRLRASLLRAGELPPRWWLRPTALHRQLDSAARPAVLLWFRIGGVAALAAFVGCALIGAAVLLALLRGVAP